MITNKNVIDLNQALDSICNSGVEGNLKFNYAISKNKRLVESETKLLIETATKKLKPYQDELSKIQDEFKKLSKEDQETKLKDYQEQAEVLNEKYKDILDEDKEFQDTESSIKLHMIDISEVPEKMPVGLFNGIYLLIKE
jgi:hypothetical protein